MAAFLSSKQCFYPLASRALYQSGVQKGKPKLHRLQLPHDMAPTKVVSYYLIFDKMPTMDFKAAFLAINDKSEAVRISCTLDEMGSDLR